MAALDLVAKNGVYVTKGGNEDRKILSNCTLQLTKACSKGWGEIRVFRKSNSQERIDQVSSEIKENVHVGKKIIKLP